jgi:hypothetical protein
VPQRLLAQGLIRLALRSPQTLGCRRIGALCVAVFPQPSLFGARGEAAVWFEFVDSHIQHRCDRADDKVIKAESKQAVADLVDVEKLAGLADGVVESDLIEMGAESRDTQIPRNDLGLEPPFFGPLHKRQCFADGAPRIIESTTSGKARAMARKIVPKYEPKVTRAKIGRPSAYHKEYAEQALHLCRLGATDHDLALAFHASVSMIKRWAATRAEFRAALEVGKEAADQRVERSLYQRAVGYHYDAVKIFMPAGAKKPIYAAYVEHVPPDSSVG